MFYEAKILSITFGTGDGANQPTIASVVSSFSTLSKLLARDQNFFGENMTNYICFHYNFGVSSINYELLLSH